MWLILLGICVQKGSGVLITLIAPPWFIVSVILLLLAIRAPEKRKIRLRKFAGGLACLLALWGVHTFYQYQTTTRADAVIAQVTAFRNKNGRYPAPQEIGAADATGIGVPHYRLEGEEKKPVLFYADTFMMFGACFYDFDKATWQCKGRD